MYFIPNGYTIKKMADTVRDKDRILVERADKKEAAEAEIVAANQRLREINQETDELLSLPEEPSQTVSKDL